MISRARAVCCVAFLANSGAIGCKRRLASHPDPTATVPPEPCRGFQGLGPEVWRVLDKCHNARNLGEYEGLLDVDERLVKDLIGATQAVADVLIG